MDVQNSIESKTNDLNFDRDKAKTTLSCILSEIFSKTMTYAEAQRLTGTDRGNIQRASQGKTLLNANAASTIIKKAYNTRSLYDIASFLKGCNHLHAYFSKELGEEYTNSNFESKDQTLRLINAIDDNITRKIFCLLYSKNKLRIETLIDLFGKNETLKSITKLEEQSIVIYHKEISIVEMPDPITSTDFAFNKKMLTLMSDNLNQSSIKSDKSLYGWDSILISDHQERLLYNEFLLFREKIFKLIENFENSNVKEKNKFVDFTLTYSNSFKYKEYKKSSSDKGLLQ